MSAKNLAPAPAPRIEPDDAARRWVGPGGCAWRIGRVGPQETPLAYWSGTVDDLARLAAETLRWRNKTDPAPSSTSGGPGVFNSHDWSGWLDIARTGYPEGAARVRETAAHLGRYLRRADVGGTARRVRRSVCGGRPVVADWLGGRPDCYRRRRRSRARSGRVVRVAMMAGAPAHVDAKALEAYVVGSLAVCKTLRALGLEVGLDALYINHCRGSGDWFPRLARAAVSVVRPGAVETDTRTAVAACVDTFRRGVFALRECTPLGVSDTFGGGYGLTTSASEVPEGVLAGWDLVLPPIVDYHPGDDPSEWADPEQAARFAGEKMPEHLETLGVTVR
jgi:hypothetical protein